MPVRAGLCEVPSVNSRVFCSDLYAARIGALFCPEIRAFTGISSTASKVRSDRRLLLKHKNGPVN